MGWRIIDMDCPSSNLWVQPIFFFVFICLHHFAHGATNPTDVAAINSLYAALGSPNIPGWVSAAGDPCGDAWQGVLCDTTNNIISITLINNNLGGELGNSLGSFSSIQSIDLSNNHIGGNIPSTLPISLKTLDLAGNNMSGELPPSMENLSALSILHLQNNQLSGTLDVLQNLPLQELNIENNLFSGSIPDKLLTIPSFKSAGNNFSTSAAPLASPPESSDGNNFSTSAAPVASPPAPSMQLSPFFQGPPTKSPPQSGTASGSRQTPGRQAVPPSVVQEPNTQKKTQSSKTKRIVGISIASVIGFIIFILALLLCMPWCFSRSKEYYRTTTRHEVQPYVGTRDNPIDYGSFSQLNNHVEKAQKNAVVDIKDEHQAPVRRIAAVPKLKNEEGLFSQRSTTPLRNLDSDMSFSDIDFMMSPPPAPPPPPPPPPPHPFLSEKVIVNPIRSEDTDPRPSTRPLPLTSVRSFPVASLQEYTNSFSQDNLLGSGMLGTVYHAELPNGKLSAIKKFDKGIANRLKDHEFLELVNTIDRIRHVNVVELMGYCSEHGQRLLIYEYCSNGTLDDALHQDDEYRKRLSWNKRTQMALGAARALEYLHEVCEPAVVHRNFKSANILLDDELNVQVSDCGLATLIASKSVSQLSGHLLSAYGYGAPEFESGIYTTQSDVYSFGVVMLELLTGRMSYDRTRTRGEQILVRWAVPQLYDIDALQRMVDPSLNGEYPIKSLSHFADIISRCVQTEPGFRPLMSEVVQDLQYLLLRGSP